jgi:gliding motility-associated lipoprotein GldH
MNKIFILFGFIVFTACSPIDKGKVYDEIIAIPSDGWPASQTLIFDVPVADTAKAYDVVLHLRNSGRFAYSNIWLFIETTSPKGNSLKDTFEIMLADDLGRWLGKGIGDVNNILVPYKENILFPVKGIYQVKITQAMREETLKNILDIGLLLQIHQ